MSKETEYQTLALLQELRKALDKTNANLEAFMAEQRSQNAKLDKKVKVNMEQVDKDLKGFKSRLAEVEDALRAVSKAVDDSSFW